MTTAILSKVMERLPCGYANATVLYNAAGEAEDGLITEVNAAFLVILSSPCNMPTAVGSSRVSECLKAFLPGSRVSREFYRELIEKQSARIERVQMIGGDDWFRVDASMIDNDSFAMTFQTEKKTQNDDAGESVLQDTGNVEADFIFNSTQDAMFVAEYVDGEFRYLRLNSAHRNLSGLQSVTIQGKTPIDVWGEETGAKLSQLYLGGIQ